VKFEEGKMPRSIFTASNSTPLIFDVPTLILSDTDHSTFVIPAILLLLLGRFNVVALRGYVYQART
jgi:hypothetical protein